MKRLILFLFVVPLIGFEVSLHAAGRDGHIVTAQASPPEICTEVYQPVCGTDQTGKRVTYSNACFSRVAKATNVTLGECPK